MTELERLIAEQQRDLRRGSFEPGEPGVMHLGDWERRLTYDGLEGAPSGAFLHPGCVIHGRAAMEPESSSWVGARCRECRREQQRGYYRAHLDEARAYREAHREERRERYKAWRRRNRDRLNTKQRERYATDPAYRERKRAAARARYQRMKQVA
jgi:hypothetical protein